MNVGSSDDARLWLHLWATAASPQVERVRELSGGVEPTVVTHRKFELAWFAIPDEDARRGQVLELHSQFDEPQLSPSPRPVGSHWPRASIADTAIVEIPVDLFDPDVQEIVSSPSKGLWMHFVEVGRRPSSAQSHDDVTYASHWDGTRSQAVRVFSIRFEDAVARGVWGIEEGSYESGAQSLGWFVTVGRAVGRVPERLHTIV